ncbi:MAG: bifunctional mannitol-1-phosphate dehydrogenase/phosphatase [Betaproteobacteria bacterium]
MYNKKAIRDLAMIFQDKDIEGAIFDMDGTMFDTERLRFKMIKQASKEILGQEISTELLYESLGVSALIGEKLAKKRYGKDYPYQKIRARADQLERAYIRKNGIPVKEGLYNLLERLKKNGVLIALATSSRREIVEEYLACAKVMRFFDIIVCGDEVEKGKPDPEIFLKAASELNCCPANCFIFEDSQNGLLSASNAGGIPIFIKDIKDPETAIKLLAFKCYEKMTDFLDELVQQTPKMPVPTLNEHFPQSIGYHTVGIHGFGAIGGGYLAQIFSHWDGYTRPRQIYGAANGGLVISLINALGKYRVKYESIAHFQTISNVSIIDINDQTKMIEMYKKSQLIGLALPEQAIKLQAKTIAKGLIERYSNGGEPLTLLIVMNKINAAKFVRNHVENAIKQLAGERKAKEIVDSTYFSETVVNRIVSRRSNKEVIARLNTDLYRMHKSIIEYSRKIEEILAFSQDYMREHTMENQNLTEKENTAIYQTISFSEHVSSITKFANELSSLNVTLFNSDPDMPIYASKGSPLLERLRQVITVDDIKSMQEIKNRLSNGPHAIIAWYSAILGYKTIGQGMGDPRVSKLAEIIIKEEIKPALLIENPNSKQYINTIASNFLKRCRASFKDKCTRVGRDPIRKLQWGERIIGTILLSQKHGLSTSGLEFGAACAIMYSLLSIDETDDEAKKVIELYGKRQFVEDVLTYNDIPGKSKFSSLASQKDKELISRIQESFNELGRKLEVLEVKGLSNLHFPLTIDESFPTRRFK